MSEAEARQIRNKAQYFLTAWVINPWNKVLREKWILFFVLNQAFAFKSSLDASLED